MKLFLILLLSCFFSCCKVTAVNNPNAIRTFNEISSIGHVSPDGNTVTVTIDQLNEHYALSSTNVIDYLVGGLIDQIPTPVKALGEAILIGDSYSYQISRQIVESAYEDGPLAAALTDPYGDGCIIN